MAMIIDKTYYCVLSQSNNFISNEILSTPFYNVTSCRILSNVQTFIQANFFYDSYLLNTETSDFDYVQGLAVAGDPLMWYRLKLNTIQNPIVSLYNPNEFNADSLQLSFQFV